MKTEGTTPLIKKIFSKVKLTVIQFFAFIILIIVLLFFNNVNSLLFHVSAEIFSSIIAFGMLMFALNTYQISKSDFFMFLGIGYTFVGMLDLFHIFSFAGLNIINNTYYDMTTKFWVTARFFELFTILCSIKFLYKKSKKHNYYLIIFAYLAVFVFFLLAIMYFNIFPSMKIEEKGLTQYKIISEYIITAGFWICIIMFSMAEKFTDKRMVYYVQISLITKVISELCFTMYIYYTDFSFVLGHLLKVTSLFFMYKGIVANGLQRPLDILINDLNKADWSLKKKEQQRKYMEEAILYNEQCYELIINQSGDAILIQIDNKIVFANSTAAKFYGTDDIEDLIGRDVFDFVVEERIKEVKQRFDLILKEKRSTPVKSSKIKNLKNQILEVEGSTNYIVYRGKPAILTCFKSIMSQGKIMSLKSDILEGEKKLNQSNEYNKALTEFFSNISHELRTPINIILGSVQLLQQQYFQYKNADDKPKNLLKIMKQNTYRLIKLVNNLIDISKYDSGYLKLEKHNHNIVRVIEDITSSVSEYFKYSDINIVFDTDSEELVMAIDEDKIERIILNLLSNAIKFTNKGDKILVSIEDKGDRVRISVKDTGIGIPENKLNSIFDRFEQVDKTFTRSREGSGIGLSLVKTLTEMHGGNISVKSKLGEGSEFIIELPVTTMNEEEKEYAITFDSKVEKIRIEFSDIYDYE